MIAKQGLGFRFLSKQHDLNCSDSIGLIPYAL